VNLGPGLHYQSLVWSYQTKPNCAPSYNTKT